MTTRRQMDANDEFQNVAAVIQRVSVDLMTSNMKRCTEKNDAFYGFLVRRWKHKKNTRGGRS